ASSKAQDNPSLLEFRVYAETRRLSVRAPARQGRRALPGCRSSCTNKVPVTLIQLTPEDRAVVTALLAARESDTEKLTKLAA
ncbi:MAG: hypothetical protein ACP5MD_11745, partial [Verrucomicrobiia bacterium]